MNILIDARLYGLENAGLGRYVINLIEELTKLDQKNNYTILLRKKYYDVLNFPGNWKKVLSDFRHYSFNEQSKLLSIIKKENPDLVHFPHFNIPILFRGKYVVTIHDMLMHKFVGISASTLPAPLYFFKQLIYRIVFAVAVKRSIKIIVPSEAVKKDLLHFYKIDENKVEVIYEG